MAMVLFVSFFYPIYFAPLYEGIISYFLPIIFKFYVDYFHDLCFLFRSWSMRIDDDLPYLSLLESLWFFLLSWESSILSSALKISFCQILETRRLGKVHWESYNLCFKSETPWKLLRHAKEGRNQRHLGHVLFRSGKLWKFGFLHPV